MRRNKQLLRQMILASLFVAMIVILTCYIKIPTQNGYIHLGDGVIYLAACVLPTPIAIFCGAFGGMFADLLGGYTLYALPSFIIKALLVLPFSHKSKKIITKHNIFASATGIIITVTGYLIADAVVISLSSSVSLTTVTPWLSAVYDIPSNIIQAVSSIAVFTIIGAALDKMNIKQKISEE